MPKMDAAALSEMIPLCWMTQKTVMFTKFYDFYGVRISITMFTRGFTWPEPGESTTPYLFKVQFNIII